MHCYLVNIINSDTSDDKVDDDGDDDDDSYHLAPMVLFLLK